MKILILNWRDIEHPEAGGAEVHLFEIFSRLAYKGHEITLLTTKFKDCAEETTYRGIKILRLADNFFFDKQARKIVKKLFAKNKYDCVIDDVNKLPFYTHRYLKDVPTLAIFHHMFGATVFSLTNFPMALYVYLKEKGYGRGYKNVNVCAVSESTASELVKLGLSEKQIEIIENGIDLDQYSPDETVERDENLLLFVGRLKKYKQVDHIFEAMNVLNKDGHALKLAIIGTGDDHARLKKRANDLGLADKINFLGYVTEDEKINYLRRAAIFINPSAKEGWGITNIEASACELPVVANDAPGLRDSVVDNLTGLLYKSNDAHDLTNKIREVINDPEDRRRIGRRGRKWAQKFSWDMSAERIEEWLLKIVCVK